MTQASVALAFNSRSEWYQPDGFRYGLSSRMPVLYRCRQKYFIRQVQNWIPQTVRAAATGLSDLKTSSYRTGSDDATSAPIEIPAAKPPQASSPPPSAPATSLLSTTPERVPPTRNSFGATSISPPHRTSHRYRQRPTGRNPLSGIAGAVDEHDWVPGDLKRGMRFARRSRGAAEDGRR
jgi:hypothetical protein